MGFALRFRADASDAGLEQACATLAATRPTAVNLAWALNEMKRALKPLRESKRARGGICEGGADGR